MDDADAGLAWDILQRYRDPATVEFDAVLVGAGLPDDVARALRFWQRESVANIKQFAAEALPVVFGALHAAQYDAADATRRAGSALAAGAEPRTPGTTPWVQPPEIVINLPEHTPPADVGRGGLEERRRTVAARLADLS